MSTDDYSGLLIRILRGEETLATAFWITLFILFGYAAYEYFVPSFSDVFEKHFFFLRIFFLSFAAISIHNSCGSSSLIARLAARSWVVLLFLAAAWSVYIFFGMTWLIIFPFVFIFTIFLVKSD